MNVRSWKLGRGSLLLLLVSFVVVSFSAVVAAQRGALPPPPPQSLRAAAPIDLTGYWVSIVNEDWRYRMVTPPKGDFQAVPVTQEAVRVANMWDPEADERAGNQCRSYGAPAIMRVPGRLHITWVDDNTLQVETDAGMQTRTFRSTQKPAPPIKPSWQGMSVATWDVPPAPRIAMSSTRSIPMPNPPPPVNGALRVVTTHIRPGYLRKNGIPYSENAVLTEYFDIVRERSGTPWLIVTSIVDDARYLTEPFIVSTHFKKQSDATGWDPTPCSSTW